MTAPTTRAELPIFLERAAAACKEAVAAHFAEARPDLRFQRQALFCLAALESSAARPELEDADIRLVRSATSDAAAVCRTEPPDVATYAVATCLDEVVVACDDILGDRTPDDDVGRWHRFLFADADLFVSREGRTWRVRAGAADAADTFLDAALGRLVALGGHRIGELTVQILAWYAYEDGVRPG